MKIMDVYIAADYDHGCFVEAYRDRKDLIYSRLFSYCRQSRVSTEEGLKIIQKVKQGEKDENKQG